MSSAKYEAEVKRLAAAIEIAVDFFKKYPPKDFNENHLNHIITVYRDWQNQLFDSPPQYRNLQSLKYSISNVFTYFQEASGDGVNYFWEQINIQQLDYKRENKLSKILKRKKIKDDIEYDYIIDVIVLYQQEGLIGLTEVELLNNLLAAYESRHSGG